MKYVIKEVNQFSGFPLSYVEISPFFISNPGYGFDYTESLDEATKFITVADAISSIVKRAMESIGAPTRRFTIVGVEEVIVPVKPSYKEIAL